MNRTTVGTDSARTIRCGVDTSASVYDDRAIFVI